MLLNSRETLCQSKIHFEQLEKLDEMNDKNEGHRKLKHLPLPLGRSSCERACRFFKLVVSLGTFK